MSDLYNRLAALTAEQREKVLDGVESYTDARMEERYDEMLDECYEPAKIAGYEYSTSRALQAIDPVAYRCGFADYVSSDESVVEWSGTYYDAAELERALDDLDDAKEDDA